MNILSIFIIATLFSILGWLFTTEYYIKLLHTINPVYGLILYYSIFYIIVYLLHVIGLDIQKTHIDIHLNTIGTILILFSFFLIFGWESEYMCKKINKDCGPKQSEDAAVFHIWKLITKDMETARFMTYVVSPFILVVTGIILIIISRKSDFFKNITIG